jgi:hypothetical protein
MRKLIAIATYLFIQVFGSIVSAAVYPYHPALPFSDLGDGYDRARPTEQVEQCIQVPKDDELIKSTGTAATFELSEVKNRESLYDRMRVSIEAEGKYGAENYRHVGLEHRGGEQ